MSLTLRSPAKLNLFLRILYKRSDNYHEIASLFQTVSLYDTITFQEASEDSFSTNDPTLPLNQNNLVIKARELFRKKSAISKPLKIHLTKNIPSQAGLGGGSGNAATTLYALNLLFNTPYSDQELANWSSEIGSDIPFFFSTGLAYCTGRGEQIKSLSIQPKRTFLLGKPSIGLSTPEVYRALDLKKVSSKDPAELLNHFMNNEPHYLNDLEIPALSLSPEIANFKYWFSTQTKTPVYMTGSGSCFFTENSMQIPTFHSVETIFRDPSHWY